MDEGCIPQDWKMAYVLPIFKKGVRNKAENYRPIRLTSIVCKLMESFVKDSIMTHMRAENLLSSKQYGFINGRSTTTQLLSYLDKCIDTIVSGGVVDTIYFDFAKSFVVFLMKDCSVNSNHTVLMVKSWNGLKLS